MFKEMEARREKKATAVEPDSNSQSYIRELKEGSYFGEISLITNLKRTCTVRAKEFCTLGFLSKRDFQKTKFEYPQIWQSFKDNIKPGYNDAGF
jgi:CRP-like cAMP-binding protein